MIRAPVRTSSRREAPRGLSTALRPPCLPAIAADGARRRCAVAPEPSSGIPGKVGTGRAARRRSIRSTRPQEITVVPPVVSSRVAWSFGITSTSVPRITPPPFTWTTSVVLSAAPGAPGESLVLSVAETGSPGAPACCTGPAGCASGSAANACGGAPRVMTSRGATKAGILTGLPSVHDSCQRAGRVDRGVAWCSPLTAGAGL